MSALERVASRESSDNSDWNESDASEFDFGQASRENSQEDAFASDTDADADDDAGAAAAFQDGGATAPPFTLMDAKELFQLEGNIVDSVCEVTFLSETDARVLLDYCKWDRMVTEQAPYERPELLDKLGITVKGADGGAAAVAAEAAPTAEVTCPICFCDYTPSEMIKLKCSHMLCPDCIGTYISLKIADGEVALHCPELKCPVPLPRQLVREHITDAAHLKKFERFCLDRFVQNNPLLKWCPGKDCTRAVRMKEQDDIIRICIPVHCRCEVEFCLTCGLDIHEPTPCTMFGLWTDLMERDSASCGWIKAHTKDCPKCKSAVQKNGGCNSVTCRCGFEFCWICMTQHNNHSFGDGKGACNRWNSETQKAVEDMNRDRANIGRFTHYMERFENHKKSLSLEATGTVMQLAEKKELLIASGLSVETVTALDKAVLVLKECREILKNTYIFAFYLKQCKEAEIFEMNQEHLETQVEGLSGHLEKQDFEEKFKDAKAVKLYFDQVLNRTRHCKQRVTNLVDHVKEGYEVGDWRFVSDKLHYIGEGGFHKAKPKQASKLPKSAQLVADEDADIARAIQQSMMDVA